MHNATTTAGQTRPCAGADRPVHDSGQEPDAWAAKRGRLAWHRAAQHDEEPGADEDLRHSEPRTVVDVTDVPALRTGRIRMNFFERGFIALTVVGSLGMIAIVISVLMH